MFALKKLKRLITRLILTSLLLPISALATEVYVSRDKAGNIIFSDQPEQGAEIHIVKPLPIVPSYVAPQQPEAETRQQPASHYTSLSIVAPSDRTQLPTGFAGNVQVSGMLSPGLKEQDQIQLLDNGQLLDSSRQTLFNLEHLNRGEHRFQLRVVNSKGETLIESNSVTLYVQRHSVLNRK